MSSSNSPCAACKLQRRKCTQECVFAPYFPPDHPQKFANVHKVFGASNVAKLLNELPASQREDAVNSLAYEADARLRDPVYGCVGYISVLQHHLRQLEIDLRNAKKELANYIGPSAMLPIIQAPGGYMSPQHVGIGHSSNGVPYNMPMMGIPHGVQGQMVIREPQQQQQQQQQFLQQQQQQMYEAQQLAAAAVAMKEQQQDVKWGFEQVQAQTQTQQNMPRQHSPQELVSFIDSGFNNGSSTVTAVGLSQMTSASANANANAHSPPLALGGFDNLNINSPQIEHPQQLQAQILFQPKQTQTSQQPQQQQQQQQQRARSEEYRSIDPSC